MNRTDVREWLLCTHAPTSVRFVMVALWLHQNDRTARTFPSVSTIAAETGLNRRTVQRALRQLEAEHEISLLDRVGSGVAVYTVGGGIRGGARGGNGQVVGAASGRPEEKQKNNGTRADTFSPGTGWLRER